MPDGDLAREREALSAVNEASAAREHRKAEAAMPTARDLVDEAVALGLRQATTQAAAGRPARHAEGNSA